eukprot:1930021-Pleurochrysis_carterae.AAC.4
MVHGLFRSRSRTGSSDTVKLGQSASSIGVIRDVLQWSAVQEEELCQPVVWMTTAAMMPFRLVLFKDDDFKLNLHVV